MKYLKLLFLLSFLLGGCAKGSHPVGDFTPSRLLPVNPVPGDMPYLNDGGAWANLPPGSDTQVLLNINGFPAWGSGGSTLPDGGIGSIWYQADSGVTALPPGTSGQVLTTNGLGLAPSYQAVNGSAQGWTTAFDCNLVSQTTQSLSSNGSYTICGQASWQRGNAAHDRVGMALTNDAGIVMAPDHTCGIDSSTRTCPYLWLEFSNISGPVFDWTTQFRWWVDIVDNGTSATDVAWVGIDVNSNAWAMLSYRGHTGALSIAQKFIVNNVNIFSNTNTLAALNHTTETMLAEWNYGSALIGAQYTVYVGEAWATSSAWPAHSAMTPWFVADAPAFTSDQVKFIGATPPAPNPLGIVVAAEANGSADNATFTITHWRLDYR